MQLPIATMADGEPHCPDRRVWRGSDKLERVLLLGRVVSEQVYDLGGGGTAPRPTRATRVQFQASIK